MSKARQLADLGNVYDDSALSHRNLIINGAMQVAQRGTTATGLTSGGYHTVDRFRVSQNLNTLGMDHLDLTSSDAPWVYGFRKSLSVDVEAATGGAGTYTFIDYHVEGYDIASSGWDHTDPNSKMTLSFWAKSSIAGTYYVEIRQRNAGSIENTIALGYTLAANTWKKVELTFGGVSGSTMTMDNAAGLSLMWVNELGTNYNSSSVIDGEWQTWDVAAQVPVMSTNWSSTVGATFELTGVQLEVGDTATPFEHRSYGDELARCQRYYEQIEYPVNGAVANCHAYNTAGVHGAFYYNEKRANPTISVNNGVMCYRGTTAQTPTTLNWVYASKRSVNINPVNGMTFTTNDASYVIANSSGLSVKIDAEL